MMNKQNIFLVIWLFVSLTLCLLFHYQLEPRLEGHVVDQKREMKTEELSGVKEYWSVLTARYGSNQPARDGKVPALFPINLPGDLGGFSGAEKTQTFIELLVPDVIRANNSVLNERKILLGLIDKKRRHHSLVAREKWWLNKLASKYGVATRNMNELLERVDIIPASLVLAQAITESGWGTSRFARLGNALYGQHVPATSNSAHILSTSGNVKVAAFDSLYDATVSYINNLNSHRAYKELRRLRAQHRIDNQLPHGAEMAAGLLAYSQIGSRYVRDLRYLIGKYDLEYFDQAVIDTSRRGRSLVFSR